MEKKQRKQRVQVTQAKCNAAKKMLANGMTQTEVGELLELNPSTISKMKKKNFILEDYLQLRKDSNNTQNEKNSDQEEKQESEKMIPGQMEMNLEEEKKEMSEQTKMMRFQAHEVDQIIKQLNDNAVMISTKLDKLNDTLSQIVRVFGP